MARNLIGTGADQVSTNSQLGSMAFQDKEGVVFTGGTGRLSKLDIDSISTQLNVSATDVFVYDTSKDSDGGDWRKRCKHTSWYNEPLNTSIRGSRREFPSIAVIVSTQYSVTIYDGDDPTLPMWMVFKTSTVSYPAWTFLVGGNHGSELVRTVAALNATIVSGLSDGPNSAWAGLHAVNFLTDDGWKANNYGGTYAGKFPFNIAQRWNGVNDNGFMTTPYQLNNSFVNDVQMYVAANAPVSPLTGLPTPTIVAATTGGINVIKDDGTVASVVHTYGASMRFDLDAGSEMAVVHNGATSGQTIDMIDTARLVRLNSGSSAPVHADNSFDSNERYYGYGYYFNINNATTPQWTPNFGQPVSPAHMGTEVAMGGSGSGSFGGLIKVFENKQSPQLGLQAVIRTDSNSGWMTGFTRVATLCDSTTETFTSSELITNGTFDTSTTGWTTYLNGGVGASISVSGGRLVMAQGSNSVWLFADQAFSTSIGKTYTVSFDVSNQSNANWNIHIGSSTGNNDLADYGYPTALSNDKYSFSFTAVSTTSYIRIRQGAGPGISASIDNVSVRRGEWDRSANNRGAIVYGTITKTAVAPGSDIVAYSGFSDTNYIRVPLSNFTLNNSNSAHLSFWAWLGTAGGSYVPVGVNTNGTYDGTSSMFAVTYGWTAAWADRYSNIGSTTNYSSKVGQWQKIDLVSSTGTTNIYVDGNLIGTAAATYAISAGSTLKIGAGESSGNGGSGAWPGYLALVKLSNSAPSADLIKKMYNDEKVLFQDNAKSTLYGTGNAVTAIAYDRDTQLLHVGTSAGRSIFQGLRRIDNTTTPVVSSISAVNGFVVEN